MISIASWLAKNHLGKVEDTMTEDFVLAEILLKVNTILLRFDGQAHLGMIIKHSSTMASRFGCSNDGEYNVI